jgi:hypothetical protein
VILGAAAFWAGCHASPGPPQAPRPEVAEPAPPASAALTRFSDPSLVPLLAPCSQRFSAHANTKEIFDWGDDESAEKLPPGALLHLRFIDESMTDTGPLHQRFESLILEDGRVFLNLPDGAGAVRIPRSKPTCTMPEGARRRLVGMLLASIHLRPLRLNRANFSELLPVDENQVLPIESFFDLPDRISLACTESPAFFCSSESPPLAPAPVGIDHQEQLISAQNGSRTHTIRVLNVPHYSWIFDAFVGTLKGCGNDGDLPQSLSRP